MRPSVEGLEEVEDHRVTYGTECHGAIRGVREELRKCDKGDRPWLVDQDDIDLTDLTGLRETLVSAVPAELRWKIARQLLAADTTGR